MREITNDQIQMTNESQGHCVCRNAAECESLGHRPRNRTSNFKALKGNAAKGYLSIKPLVGHNPRDFSECDSVPEGRQDVATGASPWYAMMERRKSRRDDRNSDGVVSCRPFRTENHLYFSNHGLTPVATTCRHIRGSNAGSIHALCLSRVPFFCGKVPLARIAILCMLLFMSRTSVAQEKPAIRMKMELMSIRNRSSGPLPVHIKLEYNKPQILEGDLELAIYDSVDVISSDDLMASLRYEGIVLAGADYEFNIVLPPLKTAVTQNWAVVASFVTKQGRIQLTSLPNRPGSAEPFDLLTTSPMERGVLLCSCFKETRRHSESANRKFLETALSLDNYNPIYSQMKADNPNEVDATLTGIQRVEIMGRTIIHFAGQWSSKDLPQDPLSYCAFDVVLLGDESLAALQKEQLDGLTAWVRAGGSVCIVPDVPMKPLQLEFLRKLFEQGLDSSANLALDAEGRLLVVSDQNTPILMSHCGLGRAVLLPASNDFSANVRKEELGSIVAFLWKVRKDQPVGQGQNWISPDVLQRLKSQGVNVERDEEGIYTRDEQYRYSANREKDGKYYFDLRQLKSQFGIDDRLSPQAEPLLSVTEQALMPSDVEMVPTWIIGMILMGYVAAIGPGDYFLLGWLRLRKYTWVLFPVITGIFTLLTVMVANAFMGSDDTGGKLVITDLADNGMPVRQTTLETLYYSSQANVRNDHKGELVVLSEDNFTNADYYNQYGQPEQRSQDSPLSYSGHFPQNYSVSHRVQQWSPVSLRTLSLEPQKSDVPPIDWNDVSLLTTPEGNTRLKAAMTQFMMAEQKKSSTPVQCFAVIYHESAVLNLMGQIPTKFFEKDRYGRYLDPTQNRYQLGQQSPSLTMLSSLPTVKTSQTNIFGLVSQIAPHGAGSLEDLAFLDSSDPSQWALVIITQQGENFEVFRKLYFVQP